MEVGNSHCQARSEQVHAAVAAAAVSATVPAIPAVKVPVAAPLAIPLVVVVAHTAALNQDVEPVAEQENAKGVCRQTATQVTLQEQ